MKEQIIKYCNDLGLTEIGIAPWPLPPESKGILTEDNPCPFTEKDVTLRLTGGTTLHSPKSAIVILFPYYVEAKEGKISNLSKYCWPPDYHLIIKDYLGTIGKYIEDTFQGKWEIHCDTSPLPDRYMAYLSGIGFYGRNKAIINPTYGSYVFIGTILTDIFLPPDQPLEKSCLDCGRCITSCPGKALVRTDSGHTDFYYQRCKSYVTQKKGALTEEEKNLIAASPSIFGCDICQDVCPHNANIPNTPLPPFQQIEPYVNVDALATLSNKEFKELCKERAFSWRGKSILTRNSDLIKKNNL